MEQAEHQETRSKEALKALRQRRKAVAQSNGLDPKDVETYPISGDVTIVNNTIPPSRLIVIVSHVMR